MVLTIQNLLSVEQLAKAKTVLRGAKFLDGGITAGGSSLKNNRELEVGEGYVTLAELVDKALRNNSEIEHKLFPRSMTRPIISRYESGMFYREHVDSPIQGSQTQLGRNMAPYGQGFIRTDFSMTLFLDDPSTYEGGELEIEVEGEKRRYKLDSGSAVFYQTGSLHSVQPVTRGFRTAAVVWIQSMIHNSESRQLVAEAYDLCQKINRAMPGSQDSFSVMDHYSSLLRHFAEI